MVLKIIPVWILLWCASASEVLDPSLYLVPSPPLTPVSSSITPEQRWLETPGLKMKTRSHDYNVHTLDAKETGEDKDKTIFPASKDPYTQTNQLWIPRSSGSFLGGIHIPLNFAITGTYGGGHNTKSSGMIATTYVNRDTGLYGGYGHAGLAGSGYGAFRRPLAGVKVFSSPTVASWGGWGNGRWGHYGEG